MTPITLYTKKIPLVFDSNGVAIIPLESLMEEISKEYSILEHGPSVTVFENYQYVTFKVIKKKESRGMGFSIGHG